MQYDFGSYFANYEIYGNSDVPEIDIKSISIPIVLVVGKNDKIADIKDSVKLEEILPNVLKLIKL